MTPTSAIKNLIWLVVFVIIIKACLPDSDDTEDDFEAEYEAALEAMPRVAFEDYFEITSRRFDREKTFFLGDRLWAADQNGRMQHSSDRGQTWAMYPLPKTEPITYLQFTQQGRQGMIVTASGMLWSTSDGGESFQEINLLERITTDVETQWMDERDFSNFSFDESMQRGLWVGLCQIYRTKDGGHSWTTHADSIRHTEREDRCVYQAVEVDNRISLAAVSLTGRILTSGDYLYRTDDDGTNWSEVCSMDEVGLLVESIASCDDMAGELPGWDQFDDYFGYDKEMMAFFEDADDKVLQQRSLEVPARLATGNYHGWIYDAGSDRYWFDNENSLAYTDDHGTHWEVVYGGLGWHSDPEFDFSLGHHLGIALAGCDVHVSKDDGKTWRQYSPDTDCVYSLAVMSEKHRLLAAAEQGVFISDDLGVSWQLAAALENPVYELSQSGSVIWGLAGEQQFIHSADAGSNWTTLKFDGHFEPDYLRCTSTGCLFRSSYAIRHYQASSDGIHEIARHELPENEEDDYFVDLETDQNLNTIWILTDTGKVLRSLDRGRTFDQPIDLEAGKDSSWSRMDRSPNGKYLVFFSDDDFVAWSGDDGETYSSLQIPILYGSPDTICWITDEQVMIDSDEGLLLSTDGGASWALTTLAATADCTVEGNEIRFYNMTLRKKIGDG